MGYITTLRGLAQLATTHHEVSRLGKARNMEEAVLEGRRLLGKEHPLTLEGCHNLDVTCRMQGTLDEARI